MYVLINSDNTVRYADNHPIDETIPQEGATLLEFPDHELQEKIHPNVWSPTFTEWCYETEMIIPDRQSVINKERHWASTKLKAIQDKLQHEQALAALGIPQPVTLKAGKNPLAEDYLALTHYLSLDNYDGVERPDLVQEL